MNQWDTPHNLSIITQEITKLQFIHKMCITALPFKALYLITIHNLLQKRKPMKNKSERKIKTDMYLRRVHGLWHLIVAIDMHGTAEE